jgi:hypothetical protein
MAWRPLYDRSYDELDPFAVKSGAWCSKNSHMEIRENVMRLICRVSTRLFGRLSKS